MKHPEPFIRFMKLTGLCPTATIIPEIGKSQAYSEPHILIDQKVLAGRPSIQTRYYDYGQARFVLTILRVPSRTGKRDKRYFIARGRWLLRESAEELQSHLFLSCALAHVHNTAVAELMKIKVRASLKEKLSALRSRCHETRPPLGLLQVETELRAVPDEILSAWHPRSVRLAAAFMEVMPEKASQFVEAMVCSSATAAARVLQTRPELRNHRLELAAAGLTSASERGR